ncbi:MAG: hypothetical protein C4325_12535 [Blastocatellia bacterium]
MQKTQEATITVTVIETRQIETGGIFGNRVVYRNREYSTQVSDTGVGRFTPAQKDTLGKTAQLIVQVGIETGRSIQTIKIFLAMASRKESHLGIGARRDTSAARNRDPAMDPEINPGQIDARSGVRPSANDGWYNVNATYDHLENVMQRNFPNRPSMWNASLQDRLRYYNGGPRALQIPSTLQYANQIMATMSLISSRSSTERFNSLGCRIK